MRLPLGGWMSYGAKYWPTGVRLPARARRFIGTVAGWTCETVQQLAAAEHIQTVILAGGVFQNLLLLEQISDILEAQSMRLLVPRYLPPNDGGLALGQLYLGAL